VVAKQKISGDRIRLKGVPARRAGSFYKASTTSFLER
jgi:hypothetical protein